MHINRKTSCVTDINAIKNCTETAPKEQSLAKKPLVKKTLAKKPYICSKCGNDFTRKSSLNRHIKTNRCKPIIEEEENDNYDMIEKIALLEAKIEALSNSNNINQNSNITYNNTINNTQNNVNTINNVNLVNFGKEDLSFISNDALRWLMERGFKSVPKLIEFVHFNKSKPEYHNIYIPSITRPWVSIYDKHKWTFINKDDAVEQLMENKLDYLTKKFHIIKDDLKDSTKRKFNRFLDNSENTEVSKTIKDEIKLILYNGRSLAKRYKNIKK
tara:strand:+ start:24004 stop:24819 length:816 start_codon:yes stop_codon:yes gene_type:complete